MDHPLIHEDQKSLRQRVIQLFQSAYTHHRSSNIIFVCGGNDREHMRMLFREYCAGNLPEFEIFLPEAAMENIFAGEAREPFDIADFEQLVGELSHAIVLFPEAPGSFAETGYFSAIKQLAQKCVLVLDSNWQDTDSFISLGPAKKISSDSIYHPPIQLDYTAPNFNGVSERIRRIEAAKYRKTLKITSFSGVSSYELFVIIYGIIDICTIATIDDVLFIMRGLFKGHISVPKIQKLFSILVGAEFLREIGDFGHVFINTSKRQLLEIKDGYKENRTEISLSLASLYQNSEPEFLRLVEASRNDN